MRVLMWAALMSVAGCGDDGGSECSADPDCPAGRYCSGGRCVSDCETDTDCGGRGAGLICNARGLCVAGADGGIDASVPCSSDVTCDDGLHCNGAETCRDGACAPGVPEVCDDGVDCTSDRCSEETRDCEHLAPDADGDGHGDADCGGVDCADDDADRFPGNAEDCDDHDEDCDLATPGVRDADGDGYSSAACCNLSDGGSACGPDCDDEASTVHPTEAETCDTIDNDCDGRIDETVGAEVCDGGDNDCDGMCDEGFECCARAIVPCPTSCGTTGTRTCSDTCTAGTCAPPTETCNGMDDDCDGSTDEPGCAMGRAAASDACGIPCDRTCGDDCRWPATCRLRETSWTHSGMGLEGDDCTYPVDSAWFVPANEAPISCNGVSTWSRLLPYGDYRVSFLLSLPDTSSDARIETLLQVFTSASAPLLVRDSMTHTVRSRTPIRYNLPIFTVAPDDCLARRAYLGTVRGTGSGGAGNGVLVHEIRFERLDTGGGDPAVIVWTPPP